MINSEQALNDIVARAKQTDAVAIDTEFVWTRTYSPQLGLIQLALSDEDCHLIDPLAIEDLSAFGELLADNAVVKIFHDAPQDLSILKNATGSTPKNIFDTRLAAGFAGLPATLSLGNLIKELLDISLPKTETRTDWLKRPLADKQVAYALDDVRYLRAARVILINRTIGPEIRAWLQEELTLLNDPDTYNGTPDNQRYTRIRGAKSLNPGSLAILRELSAWRERTAKKINRPRGHVIQDAVLLEISRKHPTTIKALQETTAISRKGVDRWGNNLITAVATGLSVPEEKLPRLCRDVRLNQKSSAVLEHLGDFIQLKSRMQGIDPALIGNNGELKKLAKILTSSSPSVQSQPVRQMKGWRKVFLKDFFRYAATS